MAIMSTTEQALIKEIRQLKNSKQISSELANKVLLAFNSLEKHKLLLLFQKDSLLCFCFLRALLLNVFTLTQLEVTIPYQKIDIKDVFRDFLLFVQEMFLYLNLFDLINSLINDKEEYLVFVHFYTGFYSRLLKIEDMLIAEDNFVVDQIFSKEFLSKEASGFIYNFVKTITTSNTLKMDPTIIVYSKLFIRHCCVCGYFEQYNIVHRLVQRIDFGNKALCCELISLVVETEGDWFNEYKLLLSTLHSIESTTSLSYTPHINYKSLLRFNKQIYQSNKSIELFLSEYKKISKLTHQIITDYSKGIGLKIIMINLLNEKLPNKEKEFETILLKLINILKTKQNLNIMGYSYVVDLIYLMAYIVKINSTTFAKQILSSKEYIKLVHTFLECTEDNVRLIGLSFFEIVALKGDAELSFQLNDLDCNHDAAQLKKFYTSFQLEDIDQINSQENNADKRIVNKISIDDSDNSSDSEYETITESNKLSDYGETLAELLVELRLDFDNNIEVERLKCVSYIMQIDNKTARKLINLVFDGNLNVNQKTLVLKSVTYCLQNNQTPTTEKKRTTQTNTSSELLKINKINWASNRLLPSSRKPNPIKPHLLEMFFYPLYNNSCKHHETLEKETITSTLVLNMILEALTVVAINSLNAIESETILPKFTKMLLKIRSTESLEISTVKQIIKSYIIIFSLAIRETAGPLCKLLLGIFDHTLDHYQVLYQSSPDPCLQSLCLNLFSAMEAFVSKIADVSSIQKN